MKPIPVEEESLSSQSVALYRQSQVLEGELGDALLTLETRPGFAGWEAITPAQQLLAAEAEIGAGERVLILPCGHGALGVWLASETRADEGSCSIPTSWLYRWRSVTGGDAGDARLGTGWSPR